MPTVRAHVVHCFFAACIAAAFAALPGSAYAQQKGPRNFELRANTPQFWKVVDRKASLTTVADGFHFTEGPVWHPRGFLYVSDEPDNKIYRVFPDGRKELFLEIGDPDG